MRLRFPGHEGARIAQTGVGRVVPEGWVSGSVGEFFDLIGGGTPAKSRPEFWEHGTIDWYTPSDLTRGRTTFVAGSVTQISQLGLEKSAARVFPPQSVLMTSRATLGVLAIASRSGTCNQGFIVIPPVDGVPPMFVYEWLADRSSELEAIATGATFKEITKGAFKRFPFVRPAPRVLEQFAELAEPIGRQIATCELVNKHLVNARDLLLPRLVTGRLDISDIDLGDLLPADTV